MNFPWTKKPAPPKRKRDRTSYTAVINRLTRLEDEMAELRDRQDALDALVLKPVGKMPHD